jgi:hypothetical protein
MTWVRTFDSRGEYAEDLDGVAWYDVPKPRWWHFCRPQTRGSFANGLVERCPCGATRLFGDGPWIERNSRSRP